MQIGRKDETLFKWSTVTLNSNIAILKTWNYFQLELKNYLSLYSFVKKKGDEMAPNFTYPQKM